jgi:hypothetical protein
MGRYHGLDNYHGHVRATSQGIAVHVQGLVPRYISADGCPRAAEWVPFPGVPGPYFAPEQSLGRS